MCGLRAAHKNQSAAAPQLLGTFIALHDRNSGRPFADRSHEHELATMAVASL